MPQIVPSILEKTKPEFNEKLVRLLKLSGVERIHIDFADGVFVPNRTLPVSELDTLSPAYDWEAHLMVQEPKDFLDYKIAGFTRIFVHYEAYANRQGLAEALKKLREQGLKSGISINPPTPVSALAEFATQADEFILMGVNPGFQGQSFIPEVYDKIAELRKLLPNAIIEVDGGVKLENIAKIARAGADLFNGGSVLLKAADLQQAYYELTSAVSAK